MRSAIVIAAVCAVASSWACGDRRREHKREPVASPEDAPRARRVIEPSTDRVGPLPPYAIRADGVGPYKLGEKLSDLLEQLASGPRIELFELTGVVHRNVIRAEDDTILIGGEQASTASFVAVVGSEVARTESGIHVGSTQEELVRALGPAAADPERARDPRLIVPGALPNLRAVIDGGRVAAMVVTAAPAPARQTTTCQRPPSSDQALGACITPAGELIVVDGDDVTIRSADGARVIATAPRARGVVFAAPLRFAGEGRDDLVVITRTDGSTARTWSIVAYRLEGTRLVRTVDAAPLYQLSIANARWIGADLRDIDLYLELTSHPDSIEVGGLLTTRSPPKAATRFRDVVVISPATVARHRGKVSSPEASDGSANPAAGSAAASGRAARDAGIDALDPAGQASAASETFSH